MFDQDLNYFSQKAKPDLLKNSNAQLVSFSFKISLPLNRFLHGKHKHKSDSHHNNSPQMFMILHHQVLILFPS